MELSQEVDQLFAALAEAQGKLENVHKSKEAKAGKTNSGKQFAGYKYADLGACIDVARPVLKEHGLAVSQGTKVDLSSGVPVQLLTTMLTHKSGQWMKSEYLMTFANNNDDQAKGKSITYARRYMFAAIIGLAQEDDEAKNRKESEEAEERLSEERAALVEAKRTGYETAATSPQALFSYHEGTVKALKTQVKRGDFNMDEYKKRADGLTGLYREVRDANGFDDQAIVNQRRNQGVTND